MTVTRTPMLLADFYKLSHRAQYPEGTEMVYSTWIPRTSRLEGVEEVVAFGFQGFIQEYLIDYFDEHFFNRPLDDVLDEYVRVIKHTLGIENPEVQHIEGLWQLRYLPILIKAVDEGTLIPLRVPMLTMENTHRDFFWVTNFLETLMSTELWFPSMSATTALQYKKVLDAWAMKTVGNTDFVPFQGHDFSMRGHTSLQSGTHSGAGHLLSFVGTDTIPAILYLEEHYGADIENELVGTSIPATEHSVMCTYGEGNEFEAYRHLIEDVYPSGFVSIVSDTWDLWKVLSDVIAPLKDVIMARDGRVVIRPDSGDPVLILCGNPDGEHELERRGVIGILYDIFGGTVNEKGFIELDPHIGAIYGDAITLERCDDICRRLSDKGFASTNTVFGIGSFTYQYVTRDTLGFTLKSTYAIVNGEERLISKDPITDDGIKKSLRGLVAVVRNSDTIVAIDNLNAEEQSMVDGNLLTPVFMDGRMLKITSLSEIRARLQN